MPRHIRTTISYYDDPGDDTEHTTSIAGKRSTFNQAQIHLDMVVTDITGSERDYTLETHGFQLFQHVSKEKEFADVNKITNVYYPEVQDLLYKIKPSTGATRVFIFDHTIRRPKPDAVDSDEERRPVKRAHIDQSEQASKNQVTRHMGQDAPRLLKSRFQVINVWRPIKTIYRDPLAVCDSGSVRDSDILPVKLLYPDWVGEPCTILPNKEHQWYYKFEQTPGEVMVFKCYDSKPVHGQACRVPHAAFTDQEMVDREPRHSIEIRALVFHEDEGSVC